MRRTLAAVVAATVGLVIGGSMIPSAAQAGHGHGAPGYDPPPIPWGACTSASLQRLNAQCGLLTVPLDYAHPRGTKIKIAVSRVNHTSSAANYQGVMLVNPGGPGVSGLTLSVLGQFVPDGVGGDYDWIGFDPRGVGSSVPSLACDPNYNTYDRPDYRPFTRAIERAWLAKTHRYAVDCARAGGALLNHVKTTDTVADMESIRKALGAQKINYYGFSYGTYLGQVYSTLHPNRVRRMVWDSNVDPRDVWYKANLNQDVAFNTSVNVYFDWIARYDSVYHLGTSGKVVRAKYYATLNKLARHPADGIGPDEWNDVFEYPAYYVYGWADVAAAFAAYVNDGDIGPIKAMWDESYPSGPGTDNSYAMYLATQCSDVQWPTNWSKWERDNWRTYAKAPFLTWNNAWFNAPCIWWDAKPGHPVRVDGSKAPPILLIDETLDPATPYESSLYIRRIYPRSVLVEGVGGTTHAGSLSGVACTDDTIAAYLATGALPARVHGNRSDKQC
ncbi:MAG TPA: alpha/beta fold hydrolase, partial [Gemmataceae bacterium]|nr:alpha/beta fold hydrolase [Gemmataceae bacterium]